MVLLIVTIITSYVHTLRSEYIILLPPVQYAEKYRFFFSCCARVLVLFAYLYSAIPVCIYNRLIPVSLAVGVAQW